MVSVLVPIAEGFEELEAITIIDLLRRAGFDVISAGLNDQPVTASRGNVLIPDTSIDKVMQQPFDLIVLPGGLPGADHLRDDPNVQQLIRSQHSAGKKIAAICAAPKALASAGILSGKTITCYPGALAQTDSSDFTISSSAVEIDGNIVTSRGPGTAMDFALTLIEQMGGKDLRDKVSDQLVRN